MFSNKLYFAMKHAKAQASEINALPTRVINRPPEMVGTGVEISFVVNAGGRAVPCIKLRNPRRTAQR